MRKMTSLPAFILAFGLAAPRLGAQTPPDPAPAPAPADAKWTEELRKRVEDLEKKSEKLERKSALDRVNFTGDFRFEAHTIRADVAPRIDGLKFQNNLVNTLFYFGATGRPPQSLDDVGKFIAQNYASYLYFTNNLTFNQLKSAVGTFTPQMQQQLFPLLMSNTHVDGYSHDNDILYTSRLRLRLKADVSKDIDFDARLSMYKVWGDSTGVQVYSGGATQINFDGTTVGVPNSDILRVERAYFDWKNMFGTPLYLSIGRRPSTGGAPLNLRQDEMRGGTPLGSVVDFQFDGITAGYHLSDESTVRLCYGLGYESGFGNGEVLKQPADRLKDAHLLGVNWDIYSSEKTFIQATWAHAFDLPDGFNGLLVLPNDPVTGAPINAPVILRFTPSKNLGDLDLGSLLLIRRDGPLDWFVSGNVSQSHPENVTTPFGGLFADPFDVPESHTGWMVYAGVRLNLNQDKTKIGFEYNHGSQYWFNFALAEDDVLGPKTSTRGNVYEAYLTHRITKNFIGKLSYIHYDFDYSNSGFPLGAPKDLSSTPVLGFPAYKNASMLSLGLTARF
jgi:hypothetical protein